MQLRLDPGGAGHLWTSKWECGGSECYHAPPGHGWLPGTDETQNYELPIAVERSPQLPTRRKRDRDREERIRQAGGPKPSLRDKAYALARERATVKTRDFTAIGIPRHYLAWMCEEDLLVKVGYGVYRAADREAA